MTSYSKRIPKALLARRRQLQFLIAGGCAFTAEYAAFLLSYYVLNITISASNIGSFLVGLLTSFLLNKLWVFAAAEHSKSTRRQVILYAVLALFNLVITTVAINGMVNSLSMPAFIAKIIAIIAIAIWNYILFSRIIFTTKAS